MHRPWFAIVSTAFFLVVMGAPHLRAQVRCCDDSRSRCVACDHAGQRVGACIPSLQFLVLDRLSAAGDRLEHAMSCPKCRAQNQHQGRACTASIEPRCGIESDVASSRAGDLSNGLRANKEFTRFETRTKPNLPIASQANISDVPPPAPFKPLPSVPETPVPVNNSSNASSDSATPKLIPTPVSEQVVAPKLTDLPESVSDISESVPLPDADLPETETKTPLPLPPQEPLPDILVDPFIDDVGQGRSGAKTGVALTAGSEPIPENPVRLTEPKRLSFNQKGIIARELASPKSTRIIFKRVFDEKIIP